jgi:hypothetical protein
MDYYDQLHSKIDIMLEQGAVTETEAEDLHIGLSRLEDEE